MNYPDWRQRLVRSLHLHRSKPEARYFQAASVDKDNLPTVRTMVFRDFVESSNALLAVTDKRSEKFTHWQTRPHAELHWYFAKTREQYRFKCSVGLIYYDMNAQDVCVTGATYLSINEARSLYNERWERLSVAAKASFYGAAPKTYVDTETTQNNRQTAEVSALSEYFTTVVFEPYGADYLDLKTTPHTRLISTRESDNWTLSSVNP
ncbi:pyridoxamine 5'-phosphate oxidase family protein [Glaciecola sp. XM2]|jgi:PPOX class probable FMN-dependent enzyme|uniref:pyridoxamine 5'-phosphate oxidase family protein n=1 Tax=Glaciecola sp. XM2 TaxID=1914931 RepID=UPI001BDF1702|nr:pyridoxamine 5'-phosphate oxidase family protein [Glaciecola sp. XM2]MBT1449561.1 pyridoxamine 5'-phosphate oxidase family protein [Glaciecola sp. XM2]